jgi:DNA (cytosine-5)-methyltransferase 1
MDRPLLYDVFCGAGGASRGYQMAGFRVLGVDNRPQPRYCGDDFVQMDAFEFFECVQQGDFPQPAAWHCSPPCQAHLKGLTAVNRALGRTMDHPDLIAPTRDALIASGLHYVIENVEGAPLRDPVRLCGSSFGLPLRRHRLFECSFFFLTPRCHHKAHRVARFWAAQRKKGEEKYSRVVQVYGHAGGRHEWPEAMGINWMAPEEMTQAIPPAYTEFIGRQLLAAIANREAA